MTCQCGKADCDCLKIVKITWYDTTEASVATWQTKLDLINSKPCLIESLGWLFIKDEEKVIMIGDKGEKDDDLYGRTQVIPINCVKNIEYLS